MSQNQSYFWQTTRHNVYLKRSAKYHLMLALMAMIAFSTICSAEIAPELSDDNGIVQAKEVTRMIIKAENDIFNARPNVNNSPLEEKSDAPSTKGTSSNAGNLGFIHAFIASISVILVSELGDKTFFIAAIMAMRHARLTVFTGAIAALGLMTVLSAVFGMAATIIPRVYTYYISTALFAIFGLKMLKEGYYMKATDAQEEMDEVESDVIKLELKRKFHEGHDDNDAKDKRKNSNSNNTVDPIGSRLASNSEMQHRQRKQPTVSTNTNDGDESDLEDERSAQRRAMLPNLISVTLNNPKVNVSSFNSSPCLPAAVNGAGTRSLSNFNCDKYTANSNEVSNDIQRSVQSVVDPGVHSANLRYSADLNETNRISINSLNKTNAAGQLCEDPANGLEIKQFGSKKRLDPESGVVRKNTKRSTAYIASRIFMQAFTMTFLAEWGDRSQLTTIILSAREDVYGVIVGGVLGHSICTGLAVIGGRMIAQKISVRTVTIVGGIVFLFFAITSLFMSPNEEV